MNSCRAWLREMRRRRTSSTQAVYQDFLKLTSQEQIEYLFEVGMVDSQWLNELIKRDPDVKDLYARVDRSSTQ